MHSPSSLLNLPTLLAQAEAPTQQMDPTTAGLLAGTGFLGIPIVIVGLAWFVMFIIVLVKQFKNDPAWHGIVGILTCQLYTYIWGWINSTRLQLKKIMLVWTALIVVMFILYGVVFVMVGGAVANQIKIDTERAKAEQAAPAAPEQN